MQIIVYGKPDCAKCNSFKDKLRLMGFKEFDDWRSYDCSNLDTEWSTGGAFIKSEVCDAMSALQLIEGDMPAIDIDGKVFTYAEAIRFLKLRKKEELS